MRNFASYLIDYRGEYFLIWLMPLLTMCIVNVSVVVDRFAGPIRVIAFITMMVALYHIGSIGRYCKWENIIVLPFMLFSIGVVPFGGMMVFHRNGSTLYSAVFTIVLFTVVHSLFTLLFAFWVSETKYVVQFKKAS